MPPQFPPTYGAIENDKIDPTRPFKDATDFGVRNDVLYGTFDVFGFR